MSVPKESCCFCENSVDFQLYVMSKVSQCSLMKQRDVPFSETSRTAPRQELKGRLLPATSHIAGSRAPGQGLDLGRDTGSWAYSL